jgi:CheY-like chemotaxis protein
MSDVAVHEPASSEPSPTILVVEDEVLVRLAIADYLRECGYKVFEASDVVEARAILAAEVAPDVVFSDVQMPGAEDGFALARWIREHHPDVQVILTSGLAGAADKAQDLCHEGPMVPKPYDREAVLRYIQDLLRKARAKPG